MDLETKIALFRGIVGEPASNLHDDQVKDYINTIAEGDVELAAALFASSVSETVGHTTTSNTTSSSCSSTVPTTQQPTPSLPSTNTNTNRVHPINIPRVNASSVDSRCISNSSVSPATSAAIGDNKSALVPEKAKPPSSKAPHKRPQQYYVGGSSSGQAVFDPVYRDDNNNNNDNDDDVNDDDNDDVKKLFSKARKIGAQEASGLENNSVVAFSGHGRRLGHTEGPSPTIQPVRKAEKTIKMKFYKNGFIVGDETKLRSMKDEAGKKFLNTIEMGLVPKEVYDRYPNTAITVALEDRGDEEYIPPPYSAFSGDGHVLTSASASAAPTAVAMSVPRGSNNSTHHHPSSFVFDPSEGSTGRVVFQTPDGRREERDVNPDRHTVNDLRFLATQILPGSLDINRIELVIRERPPRALVDYTQTINQAKCNRAMIVINILR